MKTRKVDFNRKSQPTMEGAGVKLNRAFGYYDTPMFDPFLLLDDFRSNNPDDYRKGFPWHPHRGIETITYLIHGDFEHGDSMGNKGIIESGGVQWMTAGSGIIHQEMPQVRPDGIVSGFQLWANLPASHKMMGPRYRDIKSGDIPVTVTADNCRIRLISGSFDGTQGPVTDIVTDPFYWDVEVPAETEFVIPTPAGHNVFCYVMDGEGYFCGKDEPKDILPQHYADNRSLLHFTAGGQVVVHTLESAVRFLFCCGKPIDEPIAWHGPIVMNTDAEIETALNEYRSGAFIK
jgi:quercetin 2,3-dioxygenase